jgi:hypothetical protein
MLFTPIFHFFRPYKGLGCPFIRGARLLEEIRYIYFIYIYFIYLFYKYLNDIYIYFINKKIYF